MSRSKASKGIFATAVALVIPMSFDANSAFLVASALASNMSQLSAFMPLASRVVTTTMIMMMTMSSRTRTTTTMLKVLDSNRVELLRHRHGCGTQYIDRIILFTFLSLPHNSISLLYLNFCSSSPRYQTILVFVGWLFAIHKLI